MPKLNPAPMVYVRDSNSDWVLYDIVRDHQCKRKMNP